MVRLKVILFIYLSDRYFLETILANKDIKRCELTIQCIDTESQHFNEQFLSQFTDRELVLTVVDQDSIAFTVTRSAPPPVFIDEEEETYYEIESILRVRIRAGQLEYLVRWVGYGPSDDSWRSVSDLENSRDLLDQFNREHHAEVVAALNRRTMKRRPRYDDSMSDDSDDPDFK